VIPEPLNPPRNVQIILGDCLTALSVVPAGTVDSIVTDPPYALDFSQARSSLLGAGHGGADEAACSAPGESCSCDSFGGAGGAAPVAGPSMLGQHSQNWSESATHSRGYVDNNPKLFQEWCRAWAIECFRVLKPGGHLIAFGGTRAWHRMAAGIEDAGFDIRGSMAWLYATGFAKGVNVGAAMTGSKSIGASSRQTAEDGEPRSEWDGWATALRPGHEPIVLARKPADGHCRCERQRSRYRRLEHRRVPRRR
jgi:DNA modification methylase